jgi:hypothetical protein
LVLLLTSLLSAWTCTAILDFNNCTEHFAQPHVISLSPQIIAASELPVLLVVNGTGFVPRSEILWNGSPLETTFMNSSQLEATITPQTVESFGGSTGDRVLISVMSSGTRGTVRCSSDYVSGTLFLFIE